MKLLVTGGVRSGKSRYALRRAEAAGISRCYLATAQPHDTEMQDRIARHQRERGPSWRTVEEPFAVPERLTDLGPVILVDCLTLWLSNLLHVHMEPESRRIEDAFARLCQAVASSEHTIILVTNEVGMGIVPVSPLGRRFRDLAGILAQAVAEVCDEVVFVAAGLPLRLKGPNDSQSAR